MNSGTKQPAGSSLEDQVTQDPSYQRTVKGQTLADPHKEALTLQGTIGTPSCHRLRYTAQCICTVGSVALYQVCQLVCVVLCLLSHLSFAQQTACSWLHGMHEGTLDTLHWMSADGYHVRPRCFMLGEVCDM